MGDYWNNSGWYEQQRESAARAEVEREQAREEMWARQTEMTQQSRIERENEEANARRQRQASMGGGSSVSGFHSHVSNGPVSTFLSKPLIKIGRAPALLTRGIFITLPLSIAAIYYFRSVPQWMVAIIVGVLLISASPFLTKIVSVVFRIAAILIVILIIILIVGFIFHWWSLVQ